MFLAAQKSTIDRINDPWFPEQTYPCRVRPFRRGELAPVDSVFAGLSLQSRLQRFHTGVVRLSDRARHALADVDGRQHIALVAEISVARRWTPIGLTRLHAVAPGRAEAAIEIVDAWQGCGVGKRLLYELRAAALAAGYAEITAVILPGNRLAAALLHSVFPHATFREEDHQIRYVIPLRSHRQVAV